jgi:hypothetical protein
MVGQVSETAWQFLPWLRIGFDAPHNTEIKPRIAKARITSHLCRKCR